jgi:hypothetical protein
MYRIAIATLLLFLQFAGYAEEKILHYDINIDIEKDGDLLIVEQIQVQAEGTHIKRGIYRSFPTQYKDAMGNRYRVGFDVVGVERDGKPEPYHTKEVQNGEIVYMGSESTILDPGVYSYTLTFRTNRQLGFFDDFDELYFNAIGGDWAFPIEEATVVVHLPEGATVKQHAAYSGVAGSTGCDCKTTVAGDGNIVFETTRPLQLGEQFTIAVGWPKGFVDEPGLISNVWFFLRNNFNILLGLGGLLYMFSYFYQTWRKVGVDPKGGTVIPEYRPPEGMTPAAARYIMRLGMDQKAFTAAIVNMATAGHLYIDRVKGKKYLLKKRSDDTSMLTEGERAISEALFVADDQIVLDNKEYKKFQNAKNGLKQYLEAHWQKGNFKMNSQFLLKGLLIGLGFGIGMAVFGGAHPVAIVLYIIIALGMIVLFAWLLKAPTEAGRKLMDKIEGFKMYLSTTEKDRLNTMQEQSITPQLFEQYLPFAIALGVENAWGEKFENSIKGTSDEGYHPAWYMAGHRSAFSPARFSSSLGGSFSSAISSSSSPPGSSSGSGGGGSSGGGGGGGGGGGW